MFDNVRKIVDAKDHFLIHTSTHPKPVRLAKAALKPEQCAAILKLCDGGKVGFADGTGPEVNASMPEDGDLVEATPQERAAQMAADQEQTTQTFNALGGHLRGAIMAPDPETGLPVDAVQSIDPSQTQAAPTGEVNQSVAPAPTTTDTTGTADTNGISNFAPPGPPATPAAKKSGSANTQTPAPAFAAEQTAQQAADEKAAEAAATTESKNAQVTADAVVAAQKDALKVQQDYNAAVLSNNKRLQDESQQRMNAYMSGRVDPNEFMRDLGVGGQVQAGISVLLAGIGAGLQGSLSNRALDIIQGKINQNIEEQKRRILTNKEGADFDQETAKNADIFAAHQSVRANEALQAQIALLGSQNTSADTAAELQKKLAALRDQNIANVNDLAQKQTDRQFAAKKAQSQINLTNAQADLAHQEAAKAKSDANNKGPAAAQKLQDRIIKVTHNASDGQGGVVPVTESFIANSDNPTAIAEWKNKADANGEATEALNAVKQALAVKYATIPGSEANGALQQAAYRLAGAMIVNSSGGSTRTPSPEAIKAYMAATPNLAGITSGLLGRTKGSIEGIQRDLDIRHHQIVREGQKVGR